MRIRELIPSLWKRRNDVIAVFSLLMILLHLFLRFVIHTDSDSNQIPLLAALIGGVPPLLFTLVQSLLKGNLGADLLAGISILASLFLEEYLAGAILVLMMSGGAALENYAVRNASSVLQALAKRMPSIARRREGDALIEISVDKVEPGDILAVLPHEICPVDGVVVEGHGTMDEAYLTGEPFQIDKAAGSPVISGAVNGDSLLTIKAGKRAVDSRYAKIMEVMRLSEKNKPHLRRLAEQLGSLYTPIALLTAGLAWFASHDASRFLAVLVIATPCPLLIGIPVAILGSISLAARRGIIIKNAAIFEQIDRCQTAIFDKTGTLTYGTPELSEIICLGDFQEKAVLSYAASLERYSKHPLARAIMDAARKQNIGLHEASEVSEIPGEGLRGTVSGRKIQIAGRSQLSQPAGSNLTAWPASKEGLECLAAIDGKPAAMFRFRDTPRPESLSFIRHLGSHHHFERTMILSGDRESEVRYLADKVGIREIYAGKSPEEKVAIVKEATHKTRTLFVGDGINDAPALMSATVGVAIGHHSDITSQAAGAVVMDSSLTKVDELMHIGRRMRAIALQGAVGGMLLSFAGMMLAALGHLTPVAGAITQEVIDLLAILNALRAAAPPKELSDF